MARSAGETGLRVVAGTIEHKANDVVVHSGNKSVMWPRTEEPLQTRLAQAIYAVCYTGSFRAQSLQGQVDQNDWILEEISGVIARNRELDWQWRVASVDSFGVALVHQRGWFAKFNRGDYFHREGLDIQTGQKVGVPACAGFFDEDTQYLFVRHKLFGFPLNSQEVRLYFNINPAYVKALLHNLTVVLMEWNVPFTLKCPVRLSLMNRKDQIVLYFDQRDFPVITGLLEKICGPLQKFLIDDVPLFTCPLTIGVGFAESPRSGKSFGMSRAEACASALVGLRDDGPAAFESRLLAMREEFLRLAISLEQPHLNPGSLFPYDFSLLRESAKQGLP